jgi:hypothetical protein
LVGMERILGAVECKLIAAYCAAFGDAGKDRSTTTLIEKMTSAIL